MYHFFALMLGTSLLAIATMKPAYPQEVSGEMKRWHKTTLTVEGPEASEGEASNPFLNYRMQVTFAHPESGLTYSVPGYFAADGEAANSGASSGNKWRAHLSPDRIGNWTYSVSFRGGPNVAVSDDPDVGSSVAGVDGLAGAFEIEESDKTGRDLRGKGRLEYVGKHHLQFSGDKEFFLKVGVDAPENFLAYRDFDGDFKSDGIKDDLIKDWAAHVQDWNEGDPTWRDGKGKGMIGAINYLAGQGLNAFSFLTLNIEGDDRNVFPYTDYDERLRLDCSRMDQWEIVFSHGTKQGMFLHFKTQECENVNLLDNGEVGTQRKLYYRELIARFGHHLAMNWNLGEEVGYTNAVSTDKKVAWASYFATHDPYYHPIVIHNGNKHYDMLGDASALTGFSLQTNRADFGNVHGATLDYIRRSSNAGRPWVVACDEPGDAQHSLLPDAEDPTHDDARQNALWGNLMAGGAGVEWYFGYKHAHSDLTCEDYRVRETMWNQSRTALEFFSDNEIPFWEMENANQLIDRKQAYCLRQADRLYLVYAKQATETLLDLSGANGIYEVQWFNPRIGGQPQNGTAQAVMAGGKVDIGQPPAEASRDWLAILRPGNPNRDYAPTVRAGLAQSVMMPRNGSSVTVDLQGAVSDDGKSTELQSKWSVVNGPKAAEIADELSPTTQVTFAMPGTYVLKLTANDGKQLSHATTTIQVGPFQSRVTRSIRAVDDAFTEGASVFSNQYLKLEHKRRSLVIKFDVQGLPEDLLDVQLRLHQSGDAGGGTVQVFRAKTDWTGSTLQKKNFPGKGELLGEFDVQADGGASVTLPLPELLDGDGKYAVLLTMKSGGNDVWFAGTASGNGPELVIIFEDPEGRYASFGQESGNEGEARVLSAIEDFSLVAPGDLAAGYQDPARGALAIDAAKYRDRFAAAETEYDGAAGTFDLVLTTLTETDGESSYRVFVDGKNIGEVQNPSSSRDYETVAHRFDSVELRPGITIRVEFNSASNGRIPEGDGFAYSRGRWRSIAILPPSTK